MREGLGRSAALALMLACTCRQPTEIEVQLGTDVPCARFSGVAIRAAAPGPGGYDIKPSGATTTQCSGDGTIGSIVIVPSGSNTDRVLIDVAGGVDGRDPATCVETADAAGSCIFAHRQLRYIAHEPLPISIELEGACLGVVCDPSGNQTCHAGQCIPNDVDPSTYTGPSTTGVVAPPGDAGGGDVAAPVDASPGKDAGDGGQSTSDAGSDAAPSTGACPATSRTPVAVTTGNLGDVARTMALDSAFVYLAYSNSVLYVPRGAPGSPAVAPVNWLSNGNIDPTHLAVDATSVYWIEYPPGSSATVNSTSKPPAAPGAITAGPSGTFADLKADAVGAYALTTNGAEIMSRAAGGPWMPFKQLPLPATALALDGTTVYAATAAPFTSFARATANAGTTFAGAANPVVAFAAYGGNVAWAEGPAGGPYGVKVNVGGVMTEITTLSFQQFGPESIAANSQGVYFVAQPTGATNANLGVYTVSFSNPSVLVTLASNLASGSQDVAQQRFPGIAADDACVFYYGEVSNLGIWALKP